MPPKSASTTLPQRRADQTTGRRSIPGPNSATPSNSRPPSSTTASTTGVTRRPSTAVSTSDEAFQQTRSKNTSTTGNTLQEPLHATAHASRPQPRSSRKTLASNSGFVKSDTGSIDGNVNEESRKSVDPVVSGIDNLGTEKLISERAVNAVDLSSVPATRQQVQGDGEASGVAQPGNGKRKIVRKTIRIVKKIIKRRVPKNRVLMNGSENQGLVVKAEEDSVDSSEVTKNSNLANDVIEKSNVVDDVIETNRIASKENELLTVVDDITENSHLSTDANAKYNAVEGVKEETGIIDEVKEKTNIKDVAKKKLKRVNNASDSESFVGEKAHDPSGIYYMETEPSKPDFGTRVPEQIVLANDQREIHTTAMECINSNDDITEVDKNDPMELENVNYAARPIMETDEMTENQLKDSSVQNQNIDKVDVGLSKDGDVGPVGAKIVVSVGGKSESIIEKPVSGTVEEENCSIRLNEGLILSGELEAVERKKRRKTEIFVGGLDKDTKENDIRKGFEEAGVIEEVTLVMDVKTGKNKGYAFVRFATAADAKNALAKYSKVEICGKLCYAAPVGGNDTIFLGNIDKNWKTEDVVILLEKAGIKKIDKVTLKIDPKNIERNRGFAFVEFETCKDAQIAFKQLQRKDAFGNLIIKVAWAQPLTEPDEEEILKVKSVYAEYLPSSWDGEKVKEYFRRFGDIVNVVLAKDLPSSRRNDFAFINYTTRDAALTCIEAVSRERLEDGCSKVKIAVSLAKPISKGMKLKHTDDRPIKQLSMSKQKARTSIKLHEPRNKVNLGSSSYGRVKVDNEPSTTDELVHILRQQSSTKHTPSYPSTHQARTENIPPYPRTGTDARDYHFPSPGNKRPFSLVGQDPQYMVPQGLSRMHMESYHPISGPSSSFHGVGLLSYPYRHYNQPGPGVTSESVSGRRTYHSHFETREQPPPYYEDNSRYPRY